MGTRHRFGVHVDVQRLEDREVGPYTYSKAENVLADFLAVNSVFTALLKGLCGTFPECASCNASWLAPLGRVAFDALTPSSEPSKSWSESLSIERRDSLSNFSALVPHAAATTPAFR